MPSNPYENDEYDFDAYIERDRPMRIETAVARPRKTAADGRFWMIAVHPDDVPTTTNYFGSPSMSAQHAPKAVFASKKDATEAADALARKLSPKRFVVLEAVQVHAVVTPVTVTGFEGPIDVSEG